jgi:hypothetical protein
VHDHVSCRIAVHVCEHDRRRQVGGVVGDRRAERGHARREQQADRGVVVPGHGQIVVAVTVQVTGRHRHQAVEALRDRNRWQLRKLSVPGVQERDDVAFGDQREVSSPIARELEGRDVHAAFDGIEARVERDYVALGLSAESVATAEPGVAGGAACPAVRCVALEIDAASAAFGAFESAGAPSGAADRALRAAVVAEPAVREIVLQTCARVSTASELGLATRSTRASCARTDSRCAALTGAAARARHVPSAGAGVVPSCRAGDTLPACSGSALSAFPGCSAVRSAALAGTDATRAAVVLVFGDGPQARAAAPGDEDGEKPDRLRRSARPNP